MTNNGMTEETRSGIAVIGETETTFQKTADIIDELKSNVERISETVDDHDKALEINGRIHVITKNIFDTHGEMFDEIMKTSMLHSIALILLAATMIAHLLIAH